MTLAMIALTMDSPTEQVDYYSPFTRYATADMVRMFILAWGLAVAASVLLLAWRRWHEDRVSASLFLVSLTFASSLFSAVGVVALGRPPVWWYLAGELLVLAVTTVACRVVVGEARRGVWARQR